MRWSSNWARSTSHLLFRINSYTNGVGLQKDKELALLLNTLRSLISFWSGAASLLMNLPW